MRAVLCDIEGTTTDIRFVADVLFPYAAARIPTWLPENAGRTEVVAQIAAIQKENDVGTVDEVVSVLLRWMAEDRKATPLKAIQGLIWEEGYRDGALVAHVYPDVPPALAAWRAEGRALGVYSSGSVLAQKLLFGHTIAGDLRPFFQAWFDTTTGPKRAADSYLAIAAALKVQAGEILFLSDVVQELDAALEAGLQTTLIVRAGALVAGRHPVAASFRDLLR